MKRIKVVAQAAYQFNDFCQCWVTEKEIALLAEKGIDLQILGSEDGPRRVKSEDLIDILIVDWWEHKAPENTAELCRQFHPQAKIVIVDSHWYAMNREEQAKFIKKYDYYCYTSPLAEPDTVGKMVEILFECGLKEFAARFER